MKTIKAKELRTTLKEKLELVEKGESFTIIYRSRPIAKLIPVNAGTDNANGEKILESIEKLGLKETIYSNDKRSIKEIYDEIISEKLAKYNPETQK